MGFLCTFRINFQNLNLNNISLMQNLKSGITVDWMFITVEQLWKHQQYLDLLGLDQLILKAAYTRVTVWKPEKTENCPWQGQCLLQVVQAGWRDVVSEIKSWNSACLDSETAESVSRTADPCIYKLIHWFTMAEFFGGQKQTSKLAKLKHIKESNNECHTTQISNYSRQFHTQGLKR